MHDLPPLTTSARLGALLGCSGGLLVGAGLVGSVPRVEMVGVDFSDFDRTNTVR